MLGTFADDLRQNRGGRYFLPYQEGWRPEYWSQYIAGRTLDDRDKQIVELGFGIGIRCQRIWEDIRVQEQAGPLAAICSALIENINSRYVRREIAAARSLIPDELIGQVNAQFARLKRQYFTDATPVFNFHNDIDVELLTDIISDYIFARSKHLSSTLDIPSISQSIYSCAAALTELLDNIARLKFICDQLLFLDSIILIDNNIISCRVPQGGFAETYFIQSKLSDVTECLIDLEIERRAAAYLPLEYGDYSVVGRVRSISMHSKRSTQSLPVSIDGEENLTLEPVSIPRVPAKSAFLFMRRVVDAEYLFETLERVADGRDIYRAWDVLHSLSKALLENAIHLNTSSSFSGMISYANLTNLITRTLGVSRSRARRVIDFFTFKGTSTDGIWSRPIVKMDRTFYSLAHISILEIIRIRALHHMISNLNCNKLRGEIFEQKCLQLLGSPASKRVVKLVDFSSPIYQILGGKKRQTDFLLCLGKSLLICEAKSTSHIATPREFYHGFNALRAGADQVKRRLQKLISCRLQVEKHLFGMATMSLNFIPVIVTNTHFFQGLSIEGVHVISLGTLIRYLKHEVELPCADTEYYEKEGLEMVFSHSIGGDEYKKLIKSREGVVGFAASKQIIRFDYFPLPEEGVSLSIADSEVARRESSC